MSGRACFPVQRGEGALSGLRYGGVIPTTRPPPPDLITSTGPPPNAVTLGVRISIYDCGVEGTNILSTAQALPKSHGNPREIGCPTKGPVSAPRTCWRSTRQIFRETPTGAGHIGSPLGSVTPETKSAPRPGRGSQPGCGGDMRTANGNARQREQ